MKKVKMTLVAFALVAVAGSAFAIKANFFGQGTAFCETGTTCTHRVDFRLDCNGTTTNPCFTGTPHVLIGYGANDFVATTASAKFTSTAIGQ